MGNRLFFDSLSHLTQKPLIRNAFSFGAAVDSVSIQRGHLYYKPIQDTIGTLYIFYTSHDGVLTKFWYGKGESRACHKGDKISCLSNHRALGKIGPPNNPPSNVQPEDVHKYVSSHGGYRESKTVYEKITGILEIEIPSTDGILV